MYYTDPSLNLCLAKFSDMYANCLEKEGDKKGAKEMKKASEKHMENYRNEKHECRLCGK